MVVLNSDRDGAEHVVGLNLMESVRYRGGFAKFFRYLSLIGTPPAVLVNLIRLLG